MLTCITMYDETLKKIWRWKLRRDSIYILANLTLLLKYIYQACNQRLQLDIKHWYHLHFLKNRCDCLTGFSCVNVRMPYGMPLHSKAVKSVAEPNRHSLSLIEWWSSKLSHGEFGHLISLSPAVEEKKLWQITPSFNIRLSRREARCIGTFASIIEGLVQIKITEWPAKI